MKHATSAALVALVLLLAGGGCGANGSTDADAPSGPEVDAVVAAANALDAEWTAAAARGDAAGALACFRPTPAFSFGFDGGLLTSFADFEQLVNESYAARKAMVQEEHHHHAAAVSRDVGVVTGRMQVRMTAADGTTTGAEYIYGFVCAQRDGAWKIIQAHEFSVP